MREWLAMAAMLAAFACWAGPARASGDGGCYTTWTLEARDLSCANRVVIGPGNDTRVNLLLLLRDQAGLPVEGPVPDGDNWLFDDYGSTFLDWPLLVQLLYPVAEGAAEADYSEYSGTRCQSVESGGEQFLAAVTRNRRIKAADRARLEQGRAALLTLCSEHAGTSTGSVPEDLGVLAMPHSFAGREAREFGSYIAGAAAFYAGDWRGAKARFVALRTARDEWVRETARYMEARTALNAGIEAGADEWGYFSPEAVDPTFGQESEEGFQAYLATYPNGRYASSAQGLQRRARWLQGEAERQGQAYVRALANAGAANAATADLVAEIDHKFLLAAGTGSALHDPVLLATHDLMRMRGISDPEFKDIDDFTRNGMPLLTAQELAAQQPVFADRPELFAFLQANHAFYVAQDYRRVLELLPDDARRDSYGPLQFSRQVLRGMALARLADRNEVGFWRQLIGGSKASFQRPTVELGLAMAWERAAQVDQVFAAGSPVEDGRIREILLQHAAGPEVLRGVARGTARTAKERDLAAFVLLYRELRHGQYAAAQQDLSLAPADGPLLPYDEETYVRQVPLGLFAGGAVGDGYPCPALAETVARLTRNPRDVPGRLCLGDFFRLNGFDRSDLDEAPREGALGSFADYPGQSVPRSRYYADIMAERGAAREDRAYALYRAIHCYAPSQLNTCGGEDVEPDQRAAWFRRLKNEFGDTRWGQEARYYW